MRLFLAINLDAPLRERIASAFDDIRSGSFPLRWVQPDLLHLTMKFLGEVDDARATRIPDVLRDHVRDLRPFDVAVRGAGAFPNSRAPKAVFAACDADPRLEVAQDATERAMLSVDFPVEGRPFRPHLTVARARRNARSGMWQGFASLVDAVAIDEMFPVTSIDVMHSRLRPQGPEYSVLESVALEG